MKRITQIWICIILLTLVACRDTARSKQCFDDIRGMVEGKTSEEVRRLLGEPDSRQPMVMSGERWVWWNYTYLDGKNYPPEERGRVVHLEIIFDRVNKGGKVSPQGELLTTGPLSVMYTIPADKI